MAQRCVKKNALSVKSLKFHYYRPKEFNPINMIQNEVIAENPFKSHIIGKWGLSELRKSVRIHYRPTRVQSGFENVHRGRSNNESWQLIRRFNDPHGKSGLPLVHPEPSVFFIFSECNSSNDNGPFVQSRMYEFIVTNKT